MSKYRTKPVEIEAFRLGLRGEPTPTPEWFGKEDIQRFDEEGLYIYGGLSIYGLEDTYFAQWGDYIALEDGELQVYSPEDFNELFDYVSE